MSTTRMERRVITLRGQPIQNEDGVASAVIKPGYLVDGVLSVAAHAVAAGACPRTFALERDELGAGIDDTYRGIGTISSDYQIGDTVKIGSFAPGMRVFAFVASGQNISINARLESAGDGTLRAFGSGTIIGRALETLGAVTGLTRCRVEVM
jgi:hypothetical protein